MPGAPKEVVQKIGEWIDEGSNQEKIDTICGRRYRSKKAGALAFIRAVAAYEPWPDDGTIDRTILNEHIKRFRKLNSAFGPSTFGGLAVVVRDIIQAACREIFVSHTLHLELHENHLVLSWAKSGDHHIENVCLLTVEWKDEYIDELVRGFVTMGEALAIIPDIIRVGSQGDIPRAVFDLIHAYRGRSVSLAMPLAVPGGIRTLIDRYIESIDEQNRGFEDLLNDYNIFMSITPIGYDRAFVRQDNEAMGVLMGDCVVADAKSSPPEHRPDTVVVVSTELVVDAGDPYEHRRRRFIQRVRRGGFVVKEAAQVSRDDLYGIAAARRAEESLSQLLADDRDRRKIFAVYTHTTTMMDGVLNALRDFQRTGDVRVYVDYLSPTVLKMLADPHSPVKAAICVDPFHYGRLVFRVAASRTAILEPIFCDPIHPTLLTEKESLECTVPHPCRSRRPGICYMAELPALFPDRDICLEDEKYAWKEWMEDRLARGRAFGPNLRSRRIPAP
jgi:hypothetical protein